MRFNHIAKFLGLAVGAVLVFIAIVLTVKLNTSPVYQAPAVLYSSSFLPREHSSLKFLSARRAEQNGEAAGKGDGISPQHPVNHHHPHQHDHPSDSENSSNDISESPEGGERGEAAASDDEKSVEGRDIEIRLPVHFHHKKPSSPPLLPPSEGRETGPSGSDNGAHSSETIDGEKSTDSDTDKDDSDGNGGNDDSENDSTAQATKPAEQRVEEPPESDEEDPDDAEEASKSASTPAPEPAPVTAATATAPRQQDSLPPLSLDESTHSHTHVPQKPSTNTEYTTDAVDDGFFTIFSSKGLASVERKFRFPNKRDTGLYAKMDGVECFLKGTSETRPRTTANVDAKRSHAQKSFAAVWDSEEESGASSAPERMCWCRANWFGDKCQFPGLLTSKPVNLQGVRKASSEHRIVDAFTFNMELDLLLIRLHELQDVVDVHIIVEATVALSGERKPLYFLENKHLFKAFASKIIHIVYEVDSGADIGKTGWGIVEQMYSLISSVGLPAIEATEILPSDMLLANDLDEIIHNDLLSFLRAHEGYKPLIAFHFKWTYYGFMWQNVKGNYLVCMATFELLKSHFKGDAYGIRSRPEHMSSSHEWYIGTAQSPAGWHCSWCFPTAMFPVKLDSAIHGDYPRWGDYPEKKEIPYLQRNKREGLWFDGSAGGKLLTPETDPDMFAPRWAMMNRNLFEYLFSKDVYE